MVPVVRCVLCPKGRLDDAIALAQHPEVILTTFGDVMRVPGSRQSLLQAKSEGADIRMVYSPLDALGGSWRGKILTEKWSFSPSGLKPPPPSTALTVLQAEREGIENFSLFLQPCAGGACPGGPAQQPRPAVGWLHWPWSRQAMVHWCPSLSGDCRTLRANPSTVSGFEPLDILQSLWMVLRQLAEGALRSRKPVPAAWSTTMATPVALDALAKVFTVRRTVRVGAVWEIIPASGFKMHPDLCSIDAEAKFTLPHQQVADHKACACGEILQGSKKPWECKVFAPPARRKHPIGGLHGVIGRSLRGVLQVWAHSCG